MLAAYAALAALSLPAGIPYTVRESGRCARYDRTGRRASDEGGYTRCGGVPCASEASGEEPQADSMSKRTEHSLSIARAGGDVAGLGENGRVVDEITNGKGVNVAAVNAAGVERMSNNIGDRR